MVKNLFFIATVLLSAALLSGCQSDLPGANSGDHDDQLSDEIRAKARVEQPNDRFALLALSCIHRQYPNKISHVLSSEKDVLAPQDLTPIFYGCFDWHSAVHGHWLLTRLLVVDPDGPLNNDIRMALAESFTDAKMIGELAYYSQGGRASFERPYGIAWYLQLVAELHEAHDPQLQQWRKVLQPLEDRIVQQILAWLPKLAYPVRLGTHNQSAFAFGLMIDYARAVKNSQLEKALIGRSLSFHQNDKDCPLNYEPSGEDFLSPCLMEADLMRRVFNRDEFARWLTTFLPLIPTDGRGDWLQPGVVLDDSDGKLVHLDGVNLSRAWALEGIKAALPNSDRRRPALTAAANIHAKTGIAAVSDQHYAGSHWLASFAFYLTTKRGISGTIDPQ